MTDEEMAEEIANKRCHEIMCYGHCSFNSPKHHRCGEWHREYNCALEGLKAGRPQWHDLRKDPNDLPKDDMSKVAIMTPLGEWEKGIFRRTDCECYWRIVGFNENVKVIAWCELPTFNKE